MTLAAGTKLGAYEIVAGIGAGGMGEVYRAKDTRLGRDVAVKVLPEDFLEGEERRARFEREAKLLAALNHPNIAAVFSFEEIPGPPSSSSESSRHILVMELLEGETLRAALSGSKISTKKALEWARQIAQGLAAAHEKGIVHRDLKPENVFVTKDGRLKILDFGLAKLADGGAGGEATNLPTATRGTEPGVVMGTLGYMSPEQVKGKPADARSDIFAFGAILYEMLSGQRAFHRETAAETISAILREDPPDLSMTNQNVPPGLERLVAHCLEKNPEQRFHSAHDLAFDLESVSGTSASSVPLAPASFRERNIRLRGAVFAVLVTAAIGAAWVAGRRMEKAARRGSASFSQLTYREQVVFNARFAPDGKTFVFSAAVRANAPELYIVRAEFPEAKPLGLRGAHLLAVSSRGELALLTGARHIAHNVFQGTLAHMPLEGGAPRDVLESVRDADWSPDGSGLAVIREVAGKDRLEYPAGTVLCETGGYFSDLRFSRTGDRIAFFEHPARFDNRGLVAVVDLKGRKTVLADGFWGMEGLAWSPDGKEIFFSAGGSISSFKVIALTMAGRRRTVLESAGGLTIRDVGTDGRWLAARDDFFQGMPVLLPGERAERDLSWLDLSDRPMLSADGKSIVFVEYSGSLGANYAVCMRGTDGSPVVRLGEGMPTDVSPDGRWVLAVVPTSPQQLVLYPTGAGEARRLDRGAIEGYESARFFPDGKSVLSCGHEPGHASRCYVQEIGGGKPRAIIPEGTTLGILAPDTRRVVVQTSGGGLALFPMGGGDARPVPGTAPDEVAIRFSPDGESLFVFRENQVPLRVERVALASGKRDFVRTLGPADLSGVVSVTTPFLAPDDRSYGYTYLRTISHLFLVEGAR